MIIPIYVSYQTINDYVYLIDERTKNLIYLEKFAAEVWHILEMNIEFSEMINILSDNHPEYSITTIKNTVNLILEQLRNKEVLINA